MQGRRYGNSNNQAGAFGANTGFGGFGSTQSTTPAFGAANNTTTGGMFGSNNTSSPFGGANNTTSAFGANNSTTAGGGLFGSQPKPATPSLFGAGTNTQAPAASGGLFGNTNTASTGFGSNTGTGAFGASNNTATGGGLFGNTANKPAFGGFGSTPAATTGFGGTNTTTGFGGSNTAGGLFGNQQQQQPQQQQQQQQPASNPFGASTQTNNTSTAFGGFGGQQQQQPQQSSGLFGQKPPATGGLFGSAPASTGTTGTSLFGQAPAANTTPFGANNNATGGGLFGAAPKPATGGGLFGSQPAAAANPSTSLFGGLGGQQNNQNQTNTGGLFNQPKPGGLFGNAGAQNQNTGGLFSGSTNQGGGLFGNAGQTQPTQQSSFGSSLLGNSQQGQQQQGLTASINDQSAFGTSMFANLASPQITNPGPLATPLSSSIKQKKSAILPMYKLNPASATRANTPKRGFGFSYSTYGSPSSGASSTVATPLSSSLGSGLGRALNRSMSVSNLRRSFSTEDSILAPGAFSASPNSRNYGSIGSMKKLVINRSLRNELFSPPPKESGSPSSQAGILKKRVSFDANTVGGNGVTNGLSSPLKSVQNSHATPSAEELGYLRSPKRVNVDGSANGISEPEMEQVKGNELAVVHENEPPSPTPAQKNAPAKPDSLADQEPGRYWMEPSKKEIQAMNRVQRSKVSNFTVGREGVGQIVFNVPVDLTSIDLDTIFENIVILEVRSATVYPDVAKKPPMGKGLNVPSTISLQNSWPRSRDKRYPSGEKAGAAFERHVARLKRVTDTQFIDYNKETGVWTFTVEHFTTYGLEYDDDEEPEGSSELTELDTPTADAQTSIPRTEESFDSEVSPTNSDPEDTFEFKKRKVLPGAFDNQEIFEDDAEMEDEYDQDRQSFLDERSVGSRSGDDEPVDQDDVFQDDESVRSGDHEMVGSFPQTDATAELNATSQQNEQPSPARTPGELLKARLRASRNAASPAKRQIPIEDDWLESLQQTISPRKQDRMVLKDLRANGLDLTEVEKEDAQLNRSRMVSDGKGFATSIDLMNSLFGEAKRPSKAKVSAQARPQGFQVGLLSCA
jgi:nuclear pore complex protein Nup98-Nup96